MRRCATALFVLLSAFLLGACVSPAPAPGQEGWRPAQVPAAPSLEPVAGSLFTRPSGASLFTDLRARDVGDVLTVRLVERTIALKRADTEITKDADVTGPNPTLLGEELQIGTTASLGRELTGEAQSRQSNQLTGAISVTVQAVHANGNLAVSGEKWVALNQGDEYIRVSGIVRAVDVGADNSVLSTQIADARIEYAGRGALAESNAPGLLARFFVHPIWPF